MKSILQTFIKLFARIILKKYRPEIIGITGSVGKTSTKDAVFAVLNEKFSVGKNEGNYNNELGLPLAIIGRSSGGRSLWKWFKIFSYAKWLIFVRAKKYPKILVLEMGADKPGDIANLTKLTKPSIGVVTRVGMVHSEFFGDLKEIVREKSQLIKDLPDEGVAVLNRDDEEVYQMFQTTKAKTITYGFSEESNIRATEVVVSYGENEDNDQVPRGVSFKILYKGSTVPVHLSDVLGRQHVYAALAGVAVGIAKGMNLVDATRGLFQYAPPFGRMHIVEGIKNSTLIDDTYNASPIATIAALDVLNDVILREGRKKYAVIGDMMELGAYSEQGHQEVGDYLAKLGIDYCVVVGERARSILRGAKNAGMSEENLFHFSTAEEAGLFVQKKLKRGDLVLIKGSQAVRMEKVTKELMERPLEASKQLVRQSKAWLRA